MMNLRTMMIRTGTVAVVAAGWIGWGQRTEIAAQGQDSPGAIFAMTNDATDNQVVAFNRAADGTLTPAGSFSTGGTGSGTFENSANGLILAEQSPNNLNGPTKLLFATNAGSDSITSFHVNPDGSLTLVDTKPSGGDHPISLTYRKHLLYVLNGGASNCMGGVPTISGFTVSGQGELTPMPGSTRPVSGGAVSGCAQISFNPAGDVIAVTQRVANTIDTFLVDGDGTTSGPIVNGNPGRPGPFGFTFTQRGVLLSTDNGGAAPGQGGAASYEVPANGILVPLSEAGNGRSDTCWIVNTDNGRYAYTTNFQSGDISSFRVERDGRLVLLNSTAGVVGVGASDQTLSLNSKYLYARNALLGTITVFEVGNDGSLTPRQTILAVPPGGAAIGLAGK